MSKKHRSQEDIVRQTLAEEDQPAVLTEKLALPGIRELHTKSFSEVAEVLTTVLKARKGLLSFTYTIGEDIEVSYANPRATS